MKIVYGEDLIQEPTDAGTAFYEITEKDLEDTWDKEDNIVMKYLVRTYGFEAFDLDDIGIYGGRLEGDVFLLCDSDGHDIDVDGEEVDPMFALEDYDLEALAPYIKEPDDEIIRRYFSPYSLQSDTIDVNEVALELLQAGHDLSAIIDSLEDCDLFTV